MCSWRIRSGSRDANRSDHSSRQDSLGNKEKEIRKMTAYCVKCRRKVNPEGAKKVRSKNGRMMLRGKCPICGTNVVRFI